jgi:hypothetical protein
MIIHYIEKEITEPAGLGASPEGPANNPCIITQKEGKVKLPRAWSRPRLNACRGRLCLSNPQGRQKTVETAETVETVETVESVETERQRPWIPASAGMTAP